MQPFTIMAALLDRLDACRKPATRFDYYSAKGINLPTEAPRPRRPSRWPEPLSPDPPADPAKTPKRMPPRSPVIIPPSPLTEEPPLQNAWSS
jgi:hypothetical protein